MMDSVITRDLLTNPRGAMYHINLKADEVADTILLVGDPGRVSMISAHFDQVILKRSNREIITHTGTFRGHPVSAMSTGMGTDNIEIVIQELDALKNIDFKTRKPKKDLTSLRLIRIGTSGALQPELAVVDSPMAAEYAAGIDGLIFFYRQAQQIIDPDLTHEFNQVLSLGDELAKPYVVKAPGNLLKSFDESLPRGITLTAPGFYGPQGRQLRMEVRFPDLIQKLSKIRLNGMKLANFEMETSVLYALSSLMGHEALTICEIIANRISGVFNPDYNTSVSKLIVYVLNRLFQVPNGTTP